MKTNAQFSENPHGSENERLAALDRYDILDTPSDPSLDRITRIAGAALNVPMASISLIDGHRQWLKSRQGGLSAETCKSHAFCNTTIKMSEPLVIEDAATDPRFKDNPLVVGPPHIRFYGGAPLCTPDGYNLGALCAIDTKPRRLDASQIGLLKDLADMVMSELEAKKLARTDSLTGALSRRGFRTEGERALALSVRHSHPLSCIAFDLDHFKAINDVHGHAVGDRILVETVEVCRKRLRGSDIFGRVGGEEFAVLLPHTDAARAFTVAENLRADLARLVITLPGDRVHVSASFGIADRERTNTSLDELLRRADVALYAAKDAGRNTCVVWKPPSTDPASSSSMRRVLKAGQIVFNAGRSVVDCTVRGLSQVSARLDVMSTAGIPDKFKLSIADDGFSRACSIAGKQNRTLEVVFV